MEIKISDMMDHISDDTVDILATDTASLERIREATMRKIHTQTNKTGRRRRTPRMMIVAAAAALTMMALTVTAVAVKYSSLGELAGNSIQVDGQTARTLTIANAKGTPEFEAAQAWEEKLLTWFEQGENMVEPDYVPDEYSPYNAISQEAKDALDELLASYGLKKHESGVEVRSLRELYAAAGISEFLPEDGQDGDLMASGDYYDDGTVVFNGTALLDDGTGVRYELYALAKGTFTRIGNLVADPDDFQEWTYTMAGAGDVLLAVSPDKGILMADLSNCFVFVNIPADADSDDGETGTLDSDDGETGTLDRETLQELADGIDLAALNALAG